MKMHEMMVLNAATCVLALVTQSVLGQEAQLAADRAEQRGGIAAPMRAAVRAGGRAAEKLSDEDMQEVMAFMREHSPNRVKATESLPEDSAARRGVMAFVEARYRALQAVKDEDAQLYDLGVKQVEIEDDLYGLLASAPTVADREKIRDRIRIAVRPQVETNFAERAHRLSRLREALRREERKLDADRARADDLTDARTNALVQEGTAALRRDVLRRGIREDARRDGRPAGATTRAVEK